MPASMWREVGGQVHVKGSAVIEDRGHLRGAAPASDGYYWFSEVGAGVQALCMIGKKDEILDWMWNRKHSGVRNVIADLPEIYMGVTEYKPGVRFRGLFPVGDALQAIVEGFAAMAPGSELTDVVGAIKDIKENTQKIKKGFTWFSFFKGEKKQKTIPGEMYVKFHYLQDKGMEMTRIGKKKVGFGAIYQILAYLWKM
jgi:hypothetical protein